MKSDVFWCCNIETLLRWIIDEEKQGQILGIPREHFFVPRAEDPFRMQRYGRQLETPLGVAAGPHTQLAQNIAAAWLTGARYIELKTVQVLDELEVTKPCIDMADEGYNCEWSQELKLDQSFDQYLDAWILLHILRDRFGWETTDGPGFIFNMSVGYNLEGIQSPPVQRFLDRMADCGAEKQEKIERLARWYPRVRALDIPNRISDNITISTMHGCPPDEVEKIGRYFVTERRLHTTIKLNPTLLGPGRLREILNRRLGFETTVPDLAFEHDLKYEDGVALIRALQDDARKSAVAFGVKLTNTLETRNEEQNLPKNEQMVYMSGRALHPISVNLAARLQAEFDGQLDISFSAGTDCWNFPRVIACGLRPVTVCSDLLKPGGYGRLSQYLENLARACRETQAGSLDDFVLARAGASGKDISRAGLANLEDYAQKVVDDRAYHKERFPWEGIKTPRPLTAFDCIAAPCTVTCPLPQDIPRYMYHTARGEYDRALAVIRTTNPFPNVLGMVCDHQCQEKCTRIHYDDPLLIREIKRFVARSADPDSRPVPRPANGLRVAIVGAGPSGLSCAHFLALDGFEVHLFEAKSFAGGWAADAIPSFRLDDESLRRDIDAILALGVKIHCDTPVDRGRFDRFRRDFDYVYIAVGAQESTTLGVDGEDAEGVWDQLRFLSAVRRGHRPDLGKSVAVIGGGNTAMGAARTAKRLVGPDGRVSVVYRRTRREMPAAPEEIQALLDEGIELVELTAPECMLVEDGRLRANRCFRMKLGEEDESGRRAPIRIDGSEFELKVDSVISAIGQRIRLDFFPEEALEVDPETHETQLKNVFAGGDAVRGASTLVKAVADGRKVAGVIRRRALAENGAPAPKEEKKPDPAELLRRRARREAGVPLPEIPVTRRDGFEMVIETLDEAAARREAARCLQCDELCNVCVSVCPNRANMGVVMAPTTYTLQQARTVEGGVEISDLETVRIAQRHQVVNIGDYCNECGNCTTFCPTSGAPWKDKLRVHVTAESLAASGRGYRFTAPGRMEGVRDGIACRLEITAEGYVYEDDRLRAALDRDYRAREVTLKSDDRAPVSLRPAVETAILAQALCRTALLAPGRDR